MVSAQLAQRRALRRRGATIHTAGGLPSLVPYFFPVPYVVIALRAGPEVAVLEALQWLGIALYALVIDFSLWSIAVLGRHYDLLLEGSAGHVRVRCVAFGLL